MKKFSAWIIILMLVVSVFSECAFADASRAQYGSTRQFLKALDSNDINYDYYGIDNNDYEKISIGFSDVADGTTIRFFFDENNENCYLRVYNIIDFDVSDVGDVFFAVNSLNADYKYVKFYVDSSDFSVTADLDLIFREYDVDDICMEALFRLSDILNEAYDELKQYANVTIQSQHPLGTSQLLK